MVIGPRRCPVVMFFDQRLRLDRNKYKAPDESGALRMGSGKAGTQWGQGRMRRSEFNPSTVRLGSAPSKPVVDRAINFRRNRCVFSPWVCARNNHGYQFAPMARLSPFALEIHSLHHCTPAMIRSRQ